jgi:hypothetical protein
MIGCLIRPHPMAYSALFPLCHLTCRWMLVARQVRHQGLWAQLV